MGKLKIGEVAEAVCLAAKWENTASNRRIVDSVITAFAAVVEKEVSEGNEIPFRGLGIFAMKCAGEAIRRNPQTGEMRTIYPWCSIKLRRGKVVYSDPRNAALSSSEAETAQDATTAATSTPTPTAVESKAKAVAEAPATAQAAAAGKGGQKTGKQRNK